MTHLSRIGVAMVIRRPIHPRALRLLLLHEIYRGPERRGRKRILIGHPIRIKTGLFRPHATLLELSPTGARIELANPPKVGAKIRILIGKDLTKGKPIKLQAKVIRSIRASEKNNRADSEIGVTILDAQRHAKAIKTILDRFALGPAKWESNQAQRKSDPDPESAAPQTTASETPRSLPPTRSAINEPIVEPEANEADVDERSAEGDTVATVAIVSDLPDSELDDSEAGEIDPADETAENDSVASPERRSDPRISYEERIVALGAEASRVLVGRDLCIGGMRIVSTPSISIGDVLRVALHSGSATESLVVVAEVSRDDGDDGIVLSFNSLSETQRVHLEKIIATGLAVHANDEDPESEFSMSEGIVVAEMLGMINPESDAEIDKHLDLVFDTSDLVEDAR